MERLQIARDGNIATVTLNNPGKFNALDRAMWEGLGAAMHELSADDTLRCIVLRGAGDNAFAAGADISEFASERADSAQAEKYGALIHATMQSVARCRHPVIALIKGACIGGGLEIAAMCDMRICGESSRFGVPIKNLGLTMGYGELQGVLAVVGRAVTLEILLEGRVFDAREALAKHLVNRVVADAEVEREAYALAARIAAGAPLVARWHKQFIARLDTTPQLTAQEWDEGFACFDTEDYRIGVDAFLAKSKPQFKAR
jgi:enoyl-CoA hydratase/carnithine racemase